MTADNGDSPQSGEAGFPAPRRVGWLNFRGRLNRARFWTRWFFLSMLQALFSLSFPLQEDLEKGPVASSLLGLEIAGNLALLVFFAAVLTGRLHDAGKPARPLGIAFALFFSLMLFIAYHLSGRSESGGIQMLALPFLLYVLYLLLPAFFSGTREEMNAWGPPPPPGYFL